MSLPQTTIGLLRKYGIEPQKNKGQNFLINEGILEKIIKAADINPKEIILEVGPGLGALTRQLSKIAKKVIAVELDEKMVEILKEELKDLKNIEIVRENILEFNPDNLDDYRIIANIPYNITSHFLRKFLEAKNKPREMLLMIQKEVADRICAKPGNTSLLSVSVQFYGEPKILFTVPRGNFYPAPKVDSAILRITTFTKPPEVNEEIFFKTAKAGFSSRRKQLQNNIATAFELNKTEVQKLLTKNGLNPSIRAQDLSMDDWKKLAKSLAK